MHWCLGMYGSASTWTFDLVRKLAATLVPERPVRSCFAGQEPLDFDEAACSLVVKSHAGVETEDLARRASTIIVTIRDPRDAIASLMTHAKTSFDLALGVTDATAEMCARFATDRRAMLFKFEDGFFDDPATIDKIAASFGVPLRDADRDNLFAATRREAIETFIASLETQPDADKYIDDMTGQLEVYDKVSLWHKHHAGRKGKVGRWRQELSEIQIAAIEQRMRPWMLRFGYQPATKAPPAYVMTVGRYDIII